MPQLITGCLQRMTSESHMDIIHGYFKGRITAAASVAVLEVTIQVNHEGEISILRGTLASSELPQN